jgi:hypothetical protein
MAGGTCRSFPKLAGHLVTSDGQYGFVFVGKNKRRGRGDGGRGAEVGAALDPQ